MTKQDYILVSSCIRETMALNKGKFWKGMMWILVNRLAEKMQKDNPRFDNTRFINACFHDWPSQRN